ncbi:parasitic phase-specific protein PSP-1 [Trichodelitschia bisporula]|uniref:Parasitic phase-specific protein PSP-1 n=1 Tax=Trichodelitschia bisporula TaxID=703511 RepID=A0A6G1I5B2_9PEZI|nr:parasitic phase-specific protein PSP-1 [Trichodelitschia bisporula]
MDLLKRGNNDHCTKATCSIDDSIYHYLPSLASNSAFIAIFAITAIVHLIQGIRYRTWTFCIAMVLGTVGEAVGEGGRIMLYFNPFSDPGFKLQIVLLTLSPAALAAGIYLTLKHIVITFGTSFSRIKPNWYTYIFIACDIFSILLQGGGGAVAATAHDGDKEMLDIGNNLMIAGLAFQVFTLLIFGILAGEYFWRVRGHKGTLNEATAKLRASRRFRCFLGAVAVAYVTIFIRCVYRVAEMSGGWGNPIMRNETAFTILDSLMCSLAAIALNVFHPGKCFQGAMTGRTKVDADSESATDLKGPAESVEMR